MNYYIADCHFGDGRMIDLNHRPFKNGDEMDELMIKNWNKRVEDWDDVYIVGDLICKKADPIPYLERLKGRLHLICGNHDKVILENSKAKEFFKEIVDYIVVEDTGHRIVLFHYPILEWDGFYYGSWHIYGHIHNHPSLTQRRAQKLFKALNCGVDITNFKPATFDELVTINRKDSQRSKRPEGSV